MTKTERQLKSAANKAQDLAVCLRNIDWDSKVIPILTRIEEAQLMLAEARKHLASVATTVGS